MRSAEWPPAAESHIETEPQFPGCIGGEAQIINEFIGKIREIVESVARIIQSQRIDRLNFNTANACLLHGAQFSLQLWLDDGRTKPPPAHHDSAIRRRILETGAHCRCSISLRKGGPRVDADYK